jgi:hypothetical protein
MKKRKNLRIVTMESYICFYVIDIHLSDGISQLLSKYKNTIGHRT